MPAKKSTTSKIANDIDKEKAFKSSFVANRIDKQDSMSCLDLLGDITGSYLRRVHNNVLEKEAESRINCLKKSSVDLGEF